MNLQLSVHRMSQRMTATLDHVNQKRLGEILDVSHMSEKEREVRVDL